MGQLVVFNASKTDIKVSLNDGDYFTVPAAIQPSWQASQPENPPLFINNVTAGPGELKLGSNLLTTYSSTSGPSQAGSCTITIPENIPINSVQLYLFWKDACSVAAIVLQEGQPFQAVIITRKPTSVMLNSGPTTLLSNENNIIKSIQSVTASEIKINL
ncbi:hypothetical protein [Klebsiella huaxiensis]|uniref:Uncharacterized protein n=1 Tax=Klebsiella huaxiensis TaxID=2153354 RepID=A0A564P0K3_9ENTR|nr:hypothetical protein [Klebsiella huaxiensis]MDG1642918.1 hypothetical protein [Klebsiella huaxiensis]VUS92990.1 hypothetical protein SB6422_03002 [Klebsiella huaxiensis]VUT11824.1 hypothetical protein SB6421_01051 [Klebsiella huaxiensis]